MTLNEFLAITPEELNRMNTTQLKQVAQAGARMANQRMRRLRESASGTMSPAYKTAMNRPATGRTVGQFGIKKNPAFDKYRNQLLNEIKAQRRFLNDPTSTVKGWEKYKKGVEERTGIPYEFKTLQKQFWENLHKYQELHPETYNESNRLVKEFKKVAKDPDIKDKAAYLEKIMADTDAYMEGQATEFSKLVERIRSEMSDVTDEPNI